MTIYDARPWKNATANQLKDGGYEATGPESNYSNCKLIFCDIDNIHKVSEAYKDMCLLAYS